MVFQIGDLVEVIGGDYNFSGIGSKGKVTFVGNRSFAVEFDYLKNFKYDPPSHKKHWSYTFNLEDYIYFVKQFDVPEESKKYAHVIRKIRSMEQKRKGLGYAY
jgi:hypothetical protein